MRGLWDKLCGELDNSSDKTLLSWDDCHFVGPDGLLVLAFSEDPALATMLDPLDLGVHATELPWEALYHADLGLGLGG